MIKLSFTLASLSVLLSWLCHQEALEEYPYFHQEQKGDESFCYASVRMCFCVVNWQKKSIRAFEKAIAVVCCRLSRFTLLSCFMQV